MINRRHLFTVEAVAATFGPASSLPVCSQFLRSNVTGSIDFRTSSCHTGPGRQIGNRQKGAAWDGGLDADWRNQVRRVDVPI